jgi:hypothetical protein
VAAGVFAMNYDRHPGDVDFVEFSFQGAVGLPGRTEFFFQVSPVLRTNSVGQDPFGYPVPPLDLFIDTFPSSARRPGPYFLYPQEAPYKTFFVPGVIVKPPGDGGFGASSGDLSFGLKHNILSEERGNCLGLGIRGYLEVPTETPGYNSFDWRSLAGVSGERDWGLNLMLAKRLGIAELMLDVGYRGIGDPSRGIRVQYVNSGVEDSTEFLIGDPVEAGLDLKNELLFNFGSTLPAVDAWGHQIWLVNEFSYKRYVGGGTPVERLVHPAEMRIGLQSNLPFFKPISFGFVWQLLFNNAGDGTGRRSNLLTPDGQKGDINFSEMVDPETSAVVREYFENRGASFSENSSKVFSTDNPAFDEWRNIRTDYLIVSGRGGGAALFFLTWQIGSLW